MSRILCMLVARGALLLALGLGGCGAGSLELLTEEREAPLADDASPPEGAAGAWDWTGWSPEARQDALAFFATPYEDFVAAPPAPAAQR